MWTDVESALHVTNGDAAVMNLRAAGVGGPALPWRDALHEGPVPAGLDEAELRSVRAAFLAGDGTDAETIRADLEARDAILAQAAGHEIALWFESDLYDQLALAQILDRLEPGGVLVLLDRVPFRGLGELRPSALAALWAGRVEIGSAHVATGREAWTALRAGDPEAWLRLATEPSATLRPLPAAFERLLQELPWTTDGLSRTERALLEAVAAGANVNRRAFVRSQVQERRPFLGDTWAFRVLERMAAGPAPLVTAAATPDLTDAGLDVLAGRADAAELLGIDRWIGGLHLVGPAPTWRWDPEARAPART